VADAAVDVDGDTTGHRGDDFGESVEGRERAVELAAAVVAYYDSVDVVGEGEVGVFSLVGSGC
jgi:hypothetical protein